MPASRLPQRIVTTSLWALLGYTIAVILGGVVVRATLSGDGCGAEWPTCQGGWLPQTARAAIEWGHRASSGLLVPFVLLVAVGVWRVFPRGHAARRFVAWAVAGVAVECAIGAALVLFELVAHHRSVARAAAMPAHLVTTFLLVLALTLAARSAGGRSAPSLAANRRVARAWLAALVGLLLVAITGALAALGDTLYPADSLRAGIAADFAAGAPALLALRRYHPFVALAATIPVCLLVHRTWFHPTARRLAPATLLLLATTLTIGLANLLLLAPLAMQLIHLAAAMALWIAVVLLGASALAPVPTTAAPLSVSLRDWVALTKPRVAVLLVLTGLAAMRIATAAPTLGTTVAVAIGLYFAAGGAAALNLALECDLDRRMPRTATRPTATERISRSAAIRFGAILLLLAAAVLGLATHPLAACLALAGAGVYVGVYTLWLKRRSWTNIVFGGAAGAFPPLVGWAAATGELALTAWCLFGIVFLWTPVHFWALAIALKSEYARAGVPMLPVVRGERATGAQIVAYALLTALLSAAPLFLPAPEGTRLAGTLYLGGMLLLNAGLLWRSLRLFARPDPVRGRALFHYSLIYLALLFAILATDRMLAAVPFVRAHSAG